MSSETYVIRARSTEACTSTAIETFATIDDPTPVLEDAEDFVW